MNKEKDINIITDDWLRISIFDQLTGKELAVITNEEITTAENIEVHMKPSSK